MNPADIKSHPNNNTDKYKLLIEDYSATPFVVYRLVNVMDTRLSSYLENPPKSVFVFKNNNVYWYADLTNWDLSAKEIVNNLINNSGHYIRFNKELASALRKLISFSDENYKKNLTELPSKSLLGLYNKGLMLYEDAYSIGMIPTIADLNKPRVSNYTKEVIKNLSVKDVEKKFITLTTPTTLSSISKEERDLIKIIKGKGSSTIETHLENYYWLTHGYEGPTLDKTTVIKRINVIKKDKSINIDKKLTYFEEYENNTQDMINNIENDLQMSSSEKILFSTVREWVYLKDLRKEAFFRIYALFDKIAKEISARFKINKIDVKFLIKEEINDLFLKKDMKIDLERKRYSIYLSEMGKDLAYTKSEAKMFEEKYLIGTKEGEDRILKGQPAYRGKVVGIAKIVRTIKDIEKVDVGDILVSPATNPNLISAMRKAAAFVTDVGGITCHAAIVAREMKKPCIVGTKVATKTISDGDRLEVNADEGIVKLLKKQQLREKKIILST